MFKYWYEQEGYDFVEVGEVKELCTSHGNEDLICECSNPKCRKEFVISKTNY